MARNDIRFAQINQADFSDANQMFAMATQQMNNAIESGKQTIKDFNKVVMDRNDAVIKSFINSIPKEEWQTRQQEIQEFISGIAEKSGNMYNAGAIEEYRDGRMGTLLERDNQAMLNTQKQFLHEDFLQDQMADRILAIDRNPAGESEVKRLLSLADPEVVHRYDVKRLEQDIYNAKKMAERNEAQATWNASTIAPYKNRLETITNSIERLRAMRDYAPAEEKEAINERITALDTALNNWMSQLPKGVDAIHGIFNKARIDQPKLVNENMKFKSDLSTAQTNREVAKANMQMEAEYKAKQLELREKEVKLQEQVQLGHLSLDEARVQLEEWKIANGLVNGGKGGSGSGGGKSDDKPNKELAENGYPQVYDLQSDADAPNKIRTAFRSNIVAEVEAEASKLNAQTFNEFINSKDSNLNEYLTKSEGILGYSRLQQLQSAMAQYESDRKVKLSDFEKIELVKTLNTKQSGINDWTTRGDNPMAFIVRHLPTIQNTYTSKLKEATLRAGTKHRNILQKYYHLSETELYNLLQDSGGVGDAINAIPSNKQNTAKAHNALVKKAQEEKKKREKGLEFDPVSGVAIIK